MRRSLTILLVAWVLTLSQARGQTINPIPQAEPPASSLKITGEYLTWWIREGASPAILTTSSSASQGVLGKPDTQVLYGDQRLETRHQDRFVGGRGTIDWMDGSKEYGFEARAFFLERDSTYFKAGSADGSKLLAISYIDGTTGQEASKIIAGPDPQRGLLGGSFVGYSRIEWFGEEANFVLPCIAEDNWQVDFLGGGRFFQMRDRYHNTATYLILPEKSVLFGYTDNYRIANAFYGAQIGARAEAHFDQFFVQMRGTIALGADDQRIRTFGETINATPAARIATPVGILIGANNTGDRSRFALDGAGEVGVNVGYQLNSRLRVLAGYTFIAWFDPLRAGEQVNRVANSPAFAFKGETLWVQGVSVGLEARW